MISDDRLRKLKAILEEIIRGIDRNTVYHPYYYGHLCICKHCGQRYGFHSTPLCSQGFCPQDTDEEQVWLASMLRLRGKKVTMNPPRIGC